MKERIKREERREIETKMEMALYYLTFYLPTKERTKGKWERGGGNIRGEGAFAHSKSSLRKKAEAKDFNLYAIALVPPSNSD